MKISFKSFPFYMPLILGLLLVNCTPKKTISFSISGKVTELNNRFLVLSKVENIQQKTTTIIDTLT